jgi:hypothetical protein
LLQERIKRYSLDDVLSPPVTAYHYLFQARMNGDPARVAVGPPAKVSKSPNVFPKPAVQVIACHARLNAARLIPDAEDEARVG